MAFVVGASYRENAPEVVRLVTVRLRSKPSAPPVDAEPSNGDARERPLARARARAMGDISRCC